MTQFSQNNTDLNRKVEDSSIHLADITHTTTAFLVEGTSIHPVSYTHLDVYKRQVVNCLNIFSIAAISTADDLAIFNYIIFIFNKLVYQLFISYL